MTMNRQNCPNREFTPMLANEYFLSFISLSAHIQPTEFYQLLLLSSSSVFQSAAAPGWILKIPARQQTLPVSGNFWLMKFWISILVFIFLSSGITLTPPKIEIYLLKTRLDQDNPQGYPKSLARPFQPKQTDLQDTPFIKDTDIIWYDTSRSKITLSVSGSQKIIDLQPPIIDGIQFALTVDRKPVMCGYFINRVTSQPAISYMIMNILNQDSTFSISRLLPGNHTDDRVNAILIKALSETNRLK